MQKRCILPTRMNAVNDKCCTHPSAVGVRMLGSRIPIMDACFCGFIRGVVLYADFTSERPLFFTHTHTGGARAHGRAVGSLEGAANLAAIFTCAYTGGPMRDFTSERSEVKSRPSQHQHLGPRASRPTWGLVGHPAPGTPRVVPREEGPRDFTSERSEAKSRSSPNPRREHGRITQRTGRWSVGRIADRSVGWGGDRSVGRGGDRSVGRNLW